MVNDDLANLLASILNKGIIQLNLIQSKLVGVKKNANDAKHEWVESSDQSIRPLSFPVRNSYGMTGELPPGYERPNGFLNRSR
jgi:hypothetical protein